MTYFLPTQLVSKLLDMRMQLMNIEWGGQKMKLLIANWQIVAAQCGIFNFLSYPGNFGRFVRRVSIVSLDAASLGVALLEAAAEREGLEMDNGVHQRA